VPVNARKLPTFFSQTDQLRATIETTFNEAKNSDTYAATLDSRRIRNEAWKEMYARNEELLKIDKSFQTLEKAANSILAEDVIDLWVNKDAVDALQANWSGAVSRYNNAEYEKAKEFAIKAQKSVKLIIDDGVTPIKDTSQEIIVQIIIVLVVIVIGVFVFENFYLKKKKKPEDYNEPEY
jgi:glycosylphosphatidylinositol transamidase (GPIT) subunit GPI8